jgi:hypothetical protein
LAAAAIPVVLVLVLALERLVVAELLVHRVTAEMVVAIQVYLLAHPPLKQPL